MSAARLTTLRAKGPQVADNLRDAGVMCEGWYTAEPSLVTITLRAVTKDLVARGSDHAPGAPAAH
jgi:hypothetical protein